MELVGGIGLVADELDLPDGKFIAFLDLEDEGDALILGPDGFRVDPHREVAALAVKLDDVRDIVVDDGARKRSARFRLQHLLEIVALELLVALEHNSVDGRIFHDRDEDAAAVPRKFYVQEKTRGVEALKRRVERRLGEPAVGAGVKMRADHRRIDAPVAGDRDRRIRHRCRFRAAASRECKKSAKK